MENHEKFFYVSHIIKDELPKRGLQMLYFYTKKGVKYYWGLDNNSFSEEEMKECEKTTQIVKLPRLIEIERDKNQTLWVDSEGKVYIDNMENPTLDKNKALEGILLK